LLRRTVHTHACAQAKVFSSTQLEMVALLQALEQNSTNFIGSSVQVFCDKKYSISFLVKSYWKPTLTDTKQRLRLAFGKACQVASIQLTSTPR